MRIVSMRLSITGTSVVRSPALTTVQSVGGRGYAVLPSQARECSRRHRSDAADRYPMVASTPLGARERSGWTPLVRHIPGGLFTSDNRGETWELNGHSGRCPIEANGLEEATTTPGFIPSASIREIPSEWPSPFPAVVCGSPRMEASRGRSLEAACAMNTCRRSELTNQDVQDPHRMVLCPAAPHRFWVQHHNGIFRSDDEGRQWHELTTARPSSFGFAVAVHPHDPDTAWFVPATRDSDRYPVNAQFGGQRDPQRRQDVRSRPRWIAARACLPSCLPAWPGCGCGRELFGDGIDDGWPVDQRRWWTVLAMHLTRSNPDLRRSLREVNAAFEGAFAMLLPSNVPCC